MLIQPPADGVAMLQAGAPQQALTDLGNLFGQMKIAYGKFGPPSPVALTRGARYWGCHALGFGVIALRDLERVPGVLHLSLPSTAAANVICSHQLARPASTP